MPRLHKHSKAKGRAAQPSVPMKSAMGASIPIKRTTLTDVDLEKLASKPNVQIISNGPINEEDPVTAEELIAACEEFRPLYVQLRRENPSWSEEEIRVYMYENDDAFMCFWKLTHEFAEIIASDDFKRADFEHFVKLHDKVLKKEISIGEQVHELLGGEKDTSKLVRDFKDMVIKEYDGSMAKFMSSEKKENEEVAKKFSADFLKKRRDQLNERDQGLTQTENAL